jgi:two-component system chemotaxis response regulator CheV
MAHGILLEAGTNEMELLIFTVGGTGYGINVAKVRELLKRQTIITLPHAPSAIAGSFQLREEVLTLIDLREYLEFGRMPEEQGLIIIVELNHTRCGVLVDTVEMIHRLRWENVDPPSPMLIEGGAPVTSVCRLQERVILVLDFERIVGELLGVSQAALIEAASVDSIKACVGASILVADDSAVVRRHLDTLLGNIGFERVTLCEDGESAWNELCRSIAAGEKLYDIVLTDIEMPRIDGHHLSVRIKEDPRLHSIPVILYSSVIHEDTLAKGRQVGAAAQVSKSDTPGLLRAIEQCLAERVS